MEKILLRNIDVPNYHTLAAYQGCGGYRAWEKVVQSMKPEQLIDEDLRRFRQLMERADSKR